MKLTIYFDGSCNLEENKIGIGVVILRKGRVLKKISKEAGSGTNNVAEYAALIVGLKEAKKLGAKEVEIVGDSQLVVNQIKGEYKVKAPHLKPLYSKLISLLKDFKKVKIRWVPRKKNIANKLAYLAIKGG